MIQVFPAILTDNVFELGEALRKIRDSKKFSRVQIDFIDGEYANNRTIKPAEMDLIPYLPLKFDAHLMVSENNVLIWAKEAAVMGFERVIAQMESISDPGDFRICVDGGVKKEHLQALEETGADEAVVGWKRIFEMVQ